MFALLNEVEMLTIQPKFQFEWDDNANTRSTIQVKT